MSEQQRRIFRFIYAHWRQHGYAPSRDAIARACHLSPFVVRVELARLKAKRRVNWQPDKVGTLVLTVPKSGKALYVRKGAA